MPITGIIMLEYSGIDVGGGVGVMRVSGNLSMFVGLLLKYVSTYWESQIPSESLSPHVSLKPVPSGLPQ